MEGGGSSVHIFSGKEKGSDHKSVTFSNAQKRLLLVAPSDGAARRTDEASLCGGEG